MKSDLSRMKFDFLRKTCAKRFSGIKSKPIYKNIGKFTVRTFSDRKKRIMDPAEQQRNDPGQ